MQNKLSLVLLSLWLPITVVQAAEPGLSGIDVGELGRVQSETILFKAQTERNKAERTASGESDVQQAQQVQQVLPQAGGFPTPSIPTMRPGKADGGDRRSTILKSMCRIPTIGPVRAERLLNDFGEDFLASMLVDNVSEFINLMDAKGNFVFSDRQAKRMERAMANIEFGFGEGGYQPTEFIKRYLPDGFFDLLVVDEGHEYKNSGSAQGQAMGVLAAKARKTVLLTGTLMGGYADDLFYLLFRILTQRMIEDGYRPNARGSMAPAAMSFMRDHGVLKDIYTERDGDSHKTAKGKKLSVRTVKAPGFGPKGIHRFVLPFTVFLKLKDNRLSAPTDLRTSRCACHQAR